MNQDITQIALSILKKLQYLIEVDCVKKQHYNAVV